MTTFRSDIRPGDFVYLPIRPDHLFKVLLWTKEGARLHTLPLGSTWVTWEQFKEDGYERVEG